MSDFIEVKKFRLFKGEPIITLDSQYDRLISVRRIFTPGGCVYALIDTIVGNGTRGWSGDGGAATSANIGLPTGLASDSSSNLYWVEAANFGPDYGSNIRKRAVDGTISTICGIGQPDFTIPTLGAPAAGQGLAFPISIAIDADDNIYFYEDDAERIYKIDTSGILTLYLDVQAFYNTIGVGATNVAVSSMTCFGNILYCAQQTAGDSFVFKVEAGIASLFAGDIFLSGTYSGDGGPALDAGVNRPNSITCDKDGNVYFTDLANGFFEGVVIRKVDINTLNIETWAGIPSFPSTNLEGDKLAVTIAAGARISADNLGNMIIFDQYYSRVRKIDTAGATTIIAGVADFDYGFDGDGGDPMLAKFDANSAGFGVIHVSKSTNDIDISDSDNNRIRRMPC